MITFQVRGTPRPGGSKKAFWNPKAKRIVVTDMSNNRDWRNAVAYAAAEACKEPLRGPVEVHFRFTFSRPKGHYGSGRNASVLKQTAPMWPAVKPDALKLARSTEDAMSGIAYVDDAQIVREVIEKGYGVPGCEIKIWSLNGGNNEHTEHNDASGASDTGGTDYQGQRTFDPGAGAGRRGTPQEDGHERIQG